MADYCVFGVLKLIRVIDAEDGLQFGRRVVQGHAALGIAVHGEES